jgi:hypothetical protein
MAVRTTAFRIGSDPVSRVSALEDVVSSLSADLPHRGFDEAPRWNRSMERLN